MGKWGTAPPYPARLPAASDPGSLNAAGSHTPRGEGCLPQSALVLQIHELTPNSVPATLTGVLQPGPDVSTKP